MNEACVISIGYERRSIGELIQLLVSNGVGKLIDVREAPRSRRKGFSKRALSEFLAEADIEYLHLREAGNPFRKEQADIKRCLQLYRSYLDENPEVLELLSTKLGAVPVAFLCYEREHHCCHRSILIDALTQQDKHLEVIQIDD